ncbi:hypothetical protein PPYR_02027 [Photinus pyralis]|uniref:Integrase core domain-containing protein n=1 Tax=Photinus pyralis TaxID=7054 RepID=A0A5N4B613_PHOPY|nr:hypothetical protein PPYR_02027 [Photinus pyralis]
MGTENKFVEAMQIYLNENGVIDGAADDNIMTPAFLYGTSHANQRIESWWSILRKHCSQYWMNLFSQLRNEGQFTGNFVDKSILQYCFMDLIQEELNSVALEWNSHLIRRNRRSICPPGRPDVLFNFPEIHDARDYLIQIREQNLQICEQECLFPDCPCIDKDIHDLCEILSVELSISKPVDPIDGLGKYVQLRHEILSLL